jgi:protein-tyrosine phosphatase
VLEVQPVPLTVPDPVRILVVCTANQCRSPMAEVLLRRALADQGVAADVVSAGSLPGDVAASAGSARAMARRGLDLGGHRSHQVTEDDLVRADLVVCMARRHAREAVVAHPGAWPRTFTLKELVRRGEAAGPRRRDEELGAWLDRAAAGRTRSALLADDPVDDVADPIGRPDAAYEATAAELEALVERLVAAVFPAGRATGEREG